MKYIFIFISVLFFAIGCSEDKSDQAEIIDAYITDFSDNELDFQKTSIESEDGKIFIFFNNDLRNITFPVSLNADIKVSSGAKMGSFLNGELIFSNPDEVLSIEVIAEDGTSKVWSVFLVHKQLQNSDFENWFDNMGMNGKSYSEIGLTSVTSLWATANMGTSMYKVYGTKPIIEGSNTLVEITTGETSRVDITAGTLFTGIFSLAGAIANPTDPEQATEFGTPFIFRPKSIKLKYKYQAGENYIQATLKDPTSIFGGFTTEDIPGEDECTIYAFLESRVDNVITELARAEFFSGTTDNTLAEINLNFNYTSNAEPTHISIVFSSSKDGAFWRGAVGSSLVIDDLELIYE
ncbi:MAG: PCMD domain-containing protein [Bacteroidales bacterium]|nr:PCMD domain-containing protein [Bacteroidales bacterium]